MIVDSVLSIRQGLQAPLEGVEVEGADGSLSIARIDESGESPPSEPTNGHMVLKSEAGQAV